MPGVVVTLSSPFGRSRLSVSLARAASSFMNTSCAVRWSSSPCSVRMSPRAWRWNSDTPSSCSSAETCRDTADCDSPSCSPAWVKLPASAAAWKTLSLSQSIVIIQHCLRTECRRAQVSLLAHPWPRLFGCNARVGFAMGSEEMRSFERRHAALAGGGDRLSVNIVGDIAGREHARHRGRGREQRGLDVARRLHVDLAGHQLGGWRMPDRDEDAVDRPLALLTGFDVAENDA